MVVPITAGTLLKPKNWDLTSRKKVTVEWKKVQCRLRNGANKNPVFGERKKIAPKNLLLIFEKPS